MDKKLSHEELEAIAREHDRLLKSLQLIFDTSPDMIGFAGLDGCFRDINSSFEKILGYTPEEFCGRPFLHFVHEDDRERTEKALASASAGAKLIEIENRYRCKNGECKWIDWKVWDTERDNQYIAVGRDITESVRQRERKEEIEAQRLQIQKLEAIGTLAGGIAHDFNNMLGVILGNASFGRSLLDREDPLYDILSSIQAGALQAQQLTWQLLTFARGGEPIKRTTDLNRLIEESARFVTRGARSECKFDLSPDLWLADVDPGQVNQAIGNMVINACQAMPDGGTINIKTENAAVESETGLPLSPGRYVKITVEDQGLGIPEEHLSRIFDPYFSTKEAGIGLGLATTFSIIKRHGGHIAVHSRLQAGTVFTVFLPAGSGKREETAATPAEHRGAGKILVMDDHKQILVITGIMLSEMGYDVVSATDGRQAVEMYRLACQSGRPYDLVILDLTVPGGMGGAAAMREMLKIDPGIKAIVSSGYSNDPVMADYKVHGFRGVLPKPYTRDQLAGVLNGVFGRDERP